MVNAIEAMQKGILANVPRVSVSHMVEDGECLLMVHNLNGEIIGYDIAENLVTAESFAHSLLKQIAASKSTEAK